MAQHHIYHTEAIVLGSRNRGEANKLLSIYTLEHGLIFAAVQGIRLHKSKLRYSLQDLSYVSLDIVRGREIWRVTSATHLNSFPFARSNKHSLVFMMRIAKLLERLCAGEEGNIDIFNDIVQSFVMLDDPENDITKIEALELHLVLRILHRLGYIGEENDLMNYLGDVFEQDKISDVLRNKKPIVLAINRALRESQL